MVEKLFHGLKTEQPNVIHYLVEEKQLMEYGPDKGTIQVKQNYLCNVTVVKKGHASLKLSDVTCLRCLSVYKAKRRTAAKKAILEKKERNSLKCLKCGVVLRCKECGTMITNDDQKIKKKFMVK
jgi:hypothetical protein